jgi:hypothetical protein
MTIEQFHNLKVGDLVYSEGWERTCIVWYINKTHSAIQIKPSVLSVKRGYITKSNYNSFRVLNELKLFPKR